MVQKGIKTKLKKLIPNNKTIPTCIDTFEIDNVKYIIWGVTREGDNIWVDIESDDEFGRSMKGRYYTPYNDINPELYPYILKMIEKRKDK